VLRIISLFFLLLSTPLYATEVYRSVDKNGQVVFTNQKPIDDSKHEVIDVKVKNKVGAPSQPDPTVTDIYIPYRPPRVTSSYKSSSRSRNKIDSGVIREKCQSYRKRRFKSATERKKRDYWCSRQTRGK